MENDAQSTVSAVSHFGYSQSFNIVSMGHLCQTKPLSTRSKQGLRSPSAASATSLRARRPSLKIVSSSRNYRGITLVTSDGTTDRAVQCTDNQDAVDEVPDSFNTKRITTC